MNSENIRKESKVDSNNDAYQIKSDLSRSNISSKISAANKNYLDRKRSLDIHNKSQKNQLTELNHKIFSPLMRKNRFENQDYEQIFKTRFLLIKRGKKLRRIVMRWVEFTKQGKFLYYLKSDSDQPQGCYSLYQSSFKLIEIPYTQMIFKALNNLQQQQSVSMRNSVQIDSKISEALRELSDLLGINKSAVYKSLASFTNQQDSISSYDNKILSIVSKETEFKDMIPQQKQAQPNIQDIQENIEKPFILIENEDQSLSSSSLQSHKSPNVDHQRDQNETLELKPQPLTMIVQSVKPQHSRRIDMFGMRKSNPNLNLKKSLINLKDVKKEYNKLQDEEDEFDFNEDKVQSERELNEDLEGTQIMELNTINTQSVEVSRFTRTQRELCKKINFNAEDTKQNNKLSQTLNQGDTDDLEDFKDDEDEQIIQSVIYQAPQNKNKYKGKVYFFDNDLQSQTIMMENNPLDTFTKNFCDQDSILHQQEILLKLDFNLNSNDTTVINHNLQQFEEQNEYQILEDNQNYNSYHQKENSRTSKSNISQKYKRLATGYNMDSNLNSVKHDFTQLSIDAKVRVLQQNMQNSLYDRHDILDENPYECCDPIQIRPINLELAQKITDFIGQNEGDMGNSCNNNSNQSRSHSQIGVMRRNINWKQNLEDMNSQKINMKDWNSNQALYHGIEFSWNMKLQKAKQIFKHFEKQQVKGRIDFRHTLHKIELKIFEVLITGKKSLIDVSMVKILEFEEQLQQLKSNWNKVQATATEQKVKEKFTRDENSIILFKSSDRFSNLRQSQNFQKPYLDHKGLNQELSLELLEIITAENLMFKGVLRFLSGQKFKAFMIFRECWKTYKKYEQILQTKLKISEDDIQNDKKYWYFDGDFKARLYLGLGLFYLGISALPKSLTTIIRLVGFTSGNKDKGGQYLQKCIDIKQSRSPYAALIISLFHIDQEPQLERVCSLLKVQLQAYPHSALFHWVSSIVSWKLAQLDDAVYFIERAISICPKELSSQAAFLKYEIGWFHYLKLEFQISLYRFKEVLRDCLNLDLDENENGKLEGFPIEDQLENLSLQKTNSQNRDILGESANDTQIHQDLIRKFAQNSHNDNSPKKSQLKAEIKSKKASPASRKEDFVYLPHRACLTIQLAGVYVALKRDDLVFHWLQTTIALGNQPGITRSKLDQEMGHLAFIYINHRKMTDLLTYEIIYFLHQMPKLPNTILLQIISNITDIMRKVNLSLNCADPSTYKDSTYFPDYVSGMMLTIVCYCFLGDSDIAQLFSYRLIKAIVHLPQHYNYLAVHSYYWAGRSMLAESNKREAEQMLLKAKKYKKYEFSIDNKIERVLQDIKK
ncbi:UNKNOWN [Stylonychia lemnae]|uniref:Tetratricopeptide repeat protein n=1 Tax=Stylonychia lemnae TaxID=5949 RepID=A0A078ATX3_STYLE|nr:UNKNOWN [Stylonychia lemnae]|eukprot:CDW85401.1 UNKNOWN [Stylonychia lemnae]